MADEDVATRAPEIDVKEPSMISSEDTLAQKGPSMGVRYAATKSYNAADFDNQEHCVTDRPSRTFDTIPISHFALTERK